MSTSKSIWGDRDLHPVLAEYLADIDPHLLDIGWSFETAKSVEYGLTDQSMLNHVRNGVFAIVRLNEIAPSFGAYELSDDELRKAVALFAVHDLHKLRDEQEMDEEYDIDTDEVADLVDALGEPAPRRMFHRDGVSHALKCRAEFAHLVWENTWEKFDRVVLSELEPTHPEKPGYDDRFADLNAYRS